jgi:Pectate lyase superfamily protein
MFFKKVPMKRIQQQMHWSALVSCSILLSGCPGRVSSISSEGRDAGAQAADASVALDGSREADAGSSDAGLNTETDGGMPILDAGASDAGLNSESDAGIPGSDAGPPTLAPDIFYPDGSVVVVTEAPFSAKGDGVTDDTQAIQKVLNQIAGTGRIAFFPAGVYLISDTLTTPDKQINGSNSYGFNNLQGQNEAKVVLRLKDGSAGFDAPATPKPMLTFGRHGSADWFGNSVRNLTIDTGEKNPGATGLQFFSNNFGGLREVTIRSGGAERAGAVGLDLAYNDQNGPLLVKNLTVTGFQFGIRLANLVNSATFEHLHLSGQLDTAFVNAGQAVSIRDLQSDGAPRAVLNGGIMTLVDGRLARAASNANAIENRAVLFARDVATPGFSSAVGLSDGGLGLPGPIQEYVSGAPLRLFSNQQASLKLPIKETPEIPWDAPGTWASVVTFGADPTGTNDSSAGIQAAIDSGATTVYFPRGFYLSNKTILLRGNVRRLLGMNSNLDYFGKVTPDIRVVDGQQPVVAIDRLYTGAAVEVATNRTVVLLDAVLHEVNASGTGEVFVEDVSTSPAAGWTFGPGKVWARQINPENQGTHILNNGGTLWILGLKTERGGTLIENAPGAKTELLGGFSYTTTDPSSFPMFVNNEASLSATFGEISFGPPRFNPVVSETVGGMNRVLRPTDGGIPNWIGGSVLPLYVGY